jgi:hypothetical protein
MDTSGMHTAGSGATTVKSAATATEAASSAATRKGIIGNQADGK